MICVADMYKNFDFFLQPIVPESGMLRSVERRVASDVRRCVATAPLFMICGLNVYRNVYVRPVNSCDCKQPQYILIKSKVSERGGRAVAATRHGRATTAPRRPKCELH